MANARADAATAAAHAGRTDAEVAPWDWPALSAAYAREEFAVDADALRPYFELDRVLTEGVFAAATALYGLTFAERPELARTCGTAPRCAWTRASTPWPARTGPPCTAG